MPTDERTPKIFQLRYRKRRAQTLVEVIFAIAILSVVVVMITGDLTNITKTDSAADRSIEISASNFLIGVMKSDTGFWTGSPSGGVDWNIGPAGSCYSQLGAYTDQGPGQSTWRDMPTPSSNCDFPYGDQGAPQQGQPIPGQSPAPVGDTVQYMWNAQEHNGDPNSADITVWVRRDPGAPVFEYHAIRYTSPAAEEPTGPTPSPPPTHHGGGGGGGGSPNPNPSPTGIGV